MAGVLQATLDSPGLAPVVGVIIPQLNKQRLEEIADQKKKKRDQRREDQ
jgi:hypothetical protein